ncbi:hypothetical protein Ptr902_02768 [Pyrenophora tritici-repentis]|nr:hypothetical protein Ptr902_02768 [Pyrenophora tritici-repentis]
MALVTYGVVALATSGTGLVFLAAVGAAGAATVAAKEKEGKGKEGKGAPPAYRR